MIKTALITGSAGLVGSEAAQFFFQRGYQIVGIDNNMRAYFFGSNASTVWNLEALKKKLGTAYIHYSIDIRNESDIERVFQKHQFDIIIHAAAQPSHDWAAREPLLDFSVNAYGTIVLLEKYRKYSPEATFIFMSTNKVYGDLPNMLPLVELETRYELPTEHHYYKGIDESMSIDQSIHSIFGASKIAADVMVQEYGQYFGLNTGVFRGGCLTGPAHSGTQLHGFLAYLVKCVAMNIPYSIFGYKGKQVRDNIHSFDLVNMFWHFHQKPKPGNVYNVGGARSSNISMMEAIAKAEDVLGKKGQYTYVETNRVGDHQWYISDVSKFKDDYPEWEFTYDADKIIQEICFDGHFA